MHILHAGEFNTDADLLPIAEQRPQVGDTAETLLAKLAGGVPPGIGTPALIVFGGSATWSVTPGTISAVEVILLDGSAQISVGIDAGTPVALPAGMPFRLDSGDPRLRFSNGLTIVALAGTALIISRT